MSMLSITNIIADFFCFLSLSDYTLVDNDESVEMRTWLGGRIRELEEEILGELVNNLTLIALDREGRSREIVGALAHDYKLDRSQTTGRAKLSDGHARQRGILQLARIIADILLFLELTGEENLNLDEAVEMSEWFAHNFEQFDKGVLRDLVGAFAVIAPEYGDAGEATVRDIARAYGLEEVLAADDPVRLAELEALDDAHELEERDDPLGNVPGVDWRADVRRPYLASP